MNCQSRIDADAFICPRCGFPRRASSTAWSPDPVSALETPRARRRDRYIAEKVFIVIVLVGFCVLNFVMKFDLLPSVQAHHLDGVVYAVFGAALLIVLWIELTIDRR